MTCECAPKPSCDLCPELYEAIHGLALKNA